MKCNIVWLYWFIGIIIFCIDRITKNVALVSFTQRVYSCIPGISYKVVFNRGISWGMFHSLDDSVFIVVTLLVCGVTIFIGKLAYDAYQQGECIFGHVYIIAGSLSNLVDRFCYGGVIDFILVSYHNFSWPVFNVADMAIVIGVFIIIRRQYAI